MKRKLLQTKDAGGHVAFGFIHHDIIIDDPTVSSCGRFPVDPLTTYGLTPESVAALAQINRSVQQLAAAAIQGCRQQAMLYGALAIAEADAEYWADIAHHHEFEQAAANYLQHLLPALDIAALP